MEFINNYLEFKMKEKRGVLIIEIELIGLSNELKLICMCNELMSEFLIDDMFDIGLIETVLEWALVTEDKTVITFVFI